MKKISMFVLLVGSFLVSNVHAALKAPYPPNPQPKVFVQSPTPLITNPDGDPYIENNYLEDIKFDVQGNGVAVGRVYHQQIGGAHKQFLVLEKRAWQTQWTKLPVPLINPSEPRVYCEFKAVQFIPNDPDGDFIAVGFYEPNYLSSEDKVGIVYRYSHVSQSWDRLDFSIPNNRIVYPLDLAADPLDGNRFIIVGFKRVIANAKTNPIAIEYDLRSPDSINILSVPVPGALYDDLRSITALSNGEFIASGANFYSDTLANPLFMKINRNNNVSIMSYPAFIKPDLSTIPFDSATLNNGNVMFVGNYTNNGLFAFKSYAVTLNPNNNTWTLHTPLNISDPTYPSGGTDQLWGVVQASNGKIYAGGRSQYRTQVTNRYKYRNNIQSFDGTTWKLENTPSTFTVDPSIEPFIDDDFSAEVFELTTDAAGKIYAAGHFTTDTSLVLPTFNSSLILKK